MLNAALVLALQKSAHTARTQFFQTSLTKNFFQTEILICQFCTSFGLQTQFLQLRAIYETKRHSKYCQWPRCCATRFWTTASTTNTLEYQLKWIHEQHAKDSFSYSKCTKSFCLYIIASKEARLMNPSSFPCVGLDRLIVLT